MEVAAHIPTQRSGDTPRTFLTSTPLLVTIYLLDEASFHAGISTLSSLPLHLHSHCKWPVCPGGLEPLCFLSFSTPKTSSSLHFCPLQLIRAMDLINNYNYSSETFHEDILLSDGNLPCIQPLLLHHLFLRCLVITFSGALVLWCCFPPHQALTCLRLDSMAQVFSHSLTNIVNYLFPLSLLFHPPGKSQFFKNLINILLWPTHSQCLQSGRKINT